MRTFSGRPLSLQGSLWGKRVGTDKFRCKNVDRLHQNVADRGTTQLPRRASRVPVEGHGAEYHAES